MVDISRGNLIRMHESLISGYRQISSGLRIIADGVVAERSSPEEMAELLRALADNFDQIADDA